MKKAILSVFCAFGLLSFSSNANAQLLAGVEGMRPYKLGVTAGINVSTFSGSHIDCKAGYNLGIDFMADASELIENTYVRANLLFQRKGASIDWPMSNVGDGVKFEAKARVGYLEIPLACGYAYRLTDDWTLLGETGPYIAFGLGGHYESDDFMSIDGKKFFDSSISYGDYTLVQSPKRFDFGWGFAVGGMLWSTHQIKLGYQFGLMNLNDSFLQNRNLMINYTYFFE